MFDVVIIGGGVVGCAIFSKLSRLGLNCALIEKENDVGFGSSKANSGLIHAGFDAKPSTLKAKLNVRGNFMYDEIAKKLGVPFIRNGHLVVGNDLTKIQELYERGIKNKVPSLKILDQNEIHKLEPNLNEDIKYALYAKTGGMVSSYDLPIAFAEDGILNGGKVYLSFITKQIKKVKDEFSITAKDGRCVSAKWIINACGAGFNDISKLIGAEIYPITFKRGEYYILDKSESGFVKRTVFPLPEKGTKGVLITPTVHGNTLVGPTSYKSDASTITTREGLNEIATKSSMVSKTIPLYKTIRVFSGVRNISGDDFVIEKSKKVNGVINICGICSPGLSSAPAIAEYVARLLDLDPTKEVRDNRRRAYTNINNLKVDELNKKIKGNKDFGRIVCRCENISLFEIKEALNSVLPANSVDGVKRRVRAGMGRCQGGFCLSKVMEEIKNSKKIKYEDILKDRDGSNIIISSVEGESL